MSSRGLLIRPRPMASICCSPPLRVPAIWLVRSSRRREQLEDPLQGLPNSPSGAAGRGSHLQVLQHGHVGKELAALGNQDQTHLRLLVRGRAG